MFLILKLFKKKFLANLLCRSAIGAITGAAGWAGAVTCGIFAIKLEIDVAFGALVWLVDIVMLPVVLVYVEVLYIAAKMTDVVSLVRNSRGNILHRGSRLDLQMARMTIKYRRFFT